MSEIESQNPYHFEFKKDEHADNKNYPFSVHLNYDKFARILNNTGLSGIDQGTISVIASSTMQYYPPQYSPAERFVSTSAGDGKIQFSIHLPNLSEEWKTQVQNLLNIGLMMQHKPYPKHLGDQLSVGLVTAQYMAENLGFDRNEFYDFLKNAQPSEIEDQVATTVKDHLALQTSAILGSLAETTPEILYTLKNSSLKRKVLKTANAGIPLGILGVAAGFWGDDNWNIILGSGGITTASSITRMVVSPRLARVQEKTTSKLQQKRLSGLRTPQSYEGLVTLTPRDAFYNP